MRLLTKDGDSLKLTDEFDDFAIPPFAILSHTWGASNDEITYTDLVKKRSIAGKAGFFKLHFCLEQAEKHGLKYVWIDSCCIDKRNTVELTEAINRMFEYYAMAEICFVLLTDVTFGALDEFCNSRWFTRGWTLQEMIAPKRLEFYANDGKLFGTRETLAEEIKRASGIDISTPLSSIPLDDRFAWSFRRFTKKAEDQSYCMLGILQVSMITFYGEGYQRAQDRLFDCVAIEHGRPAARALQRRLLLENIQREMRGHEGSSYSTSSPPRLQVPYLGGESRS